MGKHSRYMLLASLMICLGTGPANMTDASRVAVRVISADNHGLTAELILPTFEVEEVRGDDGGYQRILLQGWARTAGDGHPELPVKGFLIQVPQGGAVDVRLLEEAHESLQDIRVCPVPVRTVTDNGTIRTKLTRDGAAYGSSAFFPASPVEVGPRAILRGVPVVRIEVCPFRWNPATRELRYTTRLRFKVEFEESLPPAFSKEAAAGTTGPPEGPYEDLLREAILNYRGLDEAPLPWSEAVDKPAAPKTYLRIEVSRDGMYRIFYEEMAGAGFISGPLRPWGLRLFNRGQEVAIKVASASPFWFGPRDSIEFYGKGMDSLYTDTNVYWLSREWGAGKRISRIDGEITGGGEAVDSFAETLRFEENHTVWESMPGALEDDYWFWEKMTAPAVFDYTLDIPSPAPDQGETALRISFRGRSTAAPHPNHHTRVYLNGALIGDDLWDGEEEHIQEMTLSAGRLLERPNSLRIESPGDTGAVVDIIYLNRIELDYRRRFEAVRDELTFSVNHEDRAQIEISTLSRPDVRIWDITDPCDLKEVVDFSVEGVGPDYRATFEDRPEGGRSYYLFTGLQVRQPDDMRAWRPAYLKSPANGADYILIAPREFMPSLWPLLLLRWSQGLRVKIAFTEDIYNEFSYGLFDPAAIKDFLRYAYESWTRPAPTYVLLVGDANMDYRDYFEAGKENKVPTRLSITPSLGLTPDDNWFVCLQGEDVLPEMLIGRIPGSSPEAVAEVVAKIVQYELTGSGPSRSALFAADDNEMGFEDLNEELIQYLPPDFNADRVYLRLYGQVDDATQDIISSLDQGAMITNYVGHGALTNWAGEFMFESSDVASLDNGSRLTFVITLTCLNGYFAHFSDYCLAEAFVAAPDKGAVACLSPSSLGYLWEHDLLGNAIFSRIFEEEDPVLGSIVTSSKIAAFGQGATEHLMTMFTLIGDPAGRLAAWADVEP